jgi:hypothetical protein
VIRVVGFSFVVSFCPIKVPNGADFEAPGPASPIASTALLYVVKRGSEAAPEGQIRSATMESYFNEHIALHGRCAQGGKNWGKLRF